MPIRAVSTDIHAPRRKRRASGPAKFKKVDVKRAADAVAKVGLPIAAVDIRPDGTISIRTGEASNAEGGGLFDQWQDQL